MKKRIIIPGALLILAVAVFFIFFRGSSKQYEFRFDTVSRGDITMYVTATGTINPVISVQVGTQVSGIVSKLYADFNSVVKEGQVIAQIDPTFLQQAVNDASASLERAQAQFADAKRTLDRTKALFDKNLESQATYDAALTQFETNQAALKQAEASLKRAKINLAYSTIYAPINGVVIDRQVNVGQTVAASFSSPTLYTIANDLRKMQVETTVDESDIGRVSIGQEATFTVDAYPDDRFKGRVSQIRLAPVTVQNVVNYTVIIDVNNDQLKLMPGMTANVKVLVGSSSDVMRVSNLALRFQPPADIVDSAKVKELMPAGGMRGGRGQMGEGWRREWQNRESGAPGSDHQQMRRDSSRSRSSRRMAQSGEDGEMPRRTGKKPEGGVRSPEQEMTVVRPAEKTRFGIQNNFPEYEKSAYVPPHQITRGRIWVLDNSGKLQPVLVTTGLSDGRFTEITTDALKPGDRIVLGASTNSDDAASSANNPFTQRGPQQMGGRR